MSPPTDTGCKEKQTKSVHQDTNLAISTDHNNVHELYIRGLYRQHICVDVWWIDESGDWLHEYKKSNDHEKQAIDKSREDFHTTIPEIRGTHC